jgi:hypothetical protein
MQLTAARVRIRVSRPISPVASKKDAEAEGQLDKTVRFDSVKQEDYDTVFYPGGHGPLWDLAEDPNSIKLIESFLCGRKACGTGLPCPRRPAPRKEQPPASRWSRARR